MKPFYAETSLETLLLIVTYYYGTDETIRTQENLN